MADAHGNLLTTPSRMESVLERNTHADAPVNRALTKEEKIGLLREMVRIRRFEQAALKYYNAGKMGGFLHLYIGQESVAVGTMSLLGDNDHVITAYRDHGHALAVGMSMNECMAELFGKATGCSKGKGGSMHFFAPDKNYWGGHGIVAGQTPLGLGLAYGLKYKGLKGCASASSATARSTRAPSTSRSTWRALRSAGHLRHRKQRLLDGHQPGALVRLRKMPRRARRRLRHRLGCRQRLGHLRSPRQDPASPSSARTTSPSPPCSRSTPTATTATRVADANAKKYRTPEEIENYSTNHDPIRLWQKRIIAEEPDRRGVRRGTRQGPPSRKPRRRRNSPRTARCPPSSDIFTDVYFEVDHHTAAGRTGHHFFN